MHYKIKSVHYCTVHSLAFSVPVNYGTWRCCCPSPNCTLYNVYCTLYIVQHCIMNTVHCTVYSLHRTVYTVQCTVYNVHCTEPYYSCVLGNFIFAKMACSVQPLLYTVKLYSPYFTLYICTATVEWNSHLMYTVIYFSTVPYTLHLYSVQ